eukprot:COSAG01_NODE_772_length_13713_cov_71.721263_1_plen_192_part_00
MADTGCMHAVIVHGWPACWSRDQGPDLGREHAGRTAGVQHIVDLDELQLRRLEAWPEHCAGRATVRQSCARCVTYELPIESPWAVCEPVSPSEQRGAWKTFSTLAGTTRSMRRHVCAVCERSRWGVEMEPRLFTVKTFERAVRGLDLVRHCSCILLASAHESGDGGVGGRVATAATGVLQPAVYTCTVGPA